jgi:hypothetical protein
VKNLVSCASEVLGALSGVDGRDDSGACEDELAAADGVGPIRPMATPRTTTSRTVGEATTRRKGVVTAATSPV